MFNRSIQFHLLRTYGRGDNLRNTGNSYRQIHISKYQYGRIKNQHLVCKIQHKISSLSHIERTKHR